MKLKGNQIDNLLMKPNLSVLTGELQISANYVPTYMLFYEPDSIDKTPHKLKLWIKLENIQLHEILQINKDLKEISIWFTDLDGSRLKDFLSKWM